MAITAQQVKELRELTDCGIMDCKKALTEANGDIEKAKAWRDARMVEVNSYDEFKEKIEQGFFVLAHWDGTAETEAKIKEETKATIRCLPFGMKEEPGTDVYSGKPAARRVLFARSY